MMNVLVVEDDAISALFIKNVVEHSGHEVVGVCSSGDEAISLFRKTSIDLVFMDINLQGKLDGIQCAHEMLKFHSLQFVYVSSYGDDETINAAIDAHTSGFIVKPVSESDLKIALLVASKRSVCAPKGYKKSISFADDYMFDCENSVIENSEEVIELTKQESKVLKIMLNAQAKPISAETIARELYADESANVTAIRNLVRRLRKKLPEAIGTLKGDGYIINNVKSFYE